MNEYKLNESERRHIAEVQEQLRNFDAENLRLEGMIKRNDREVSFMRRHLQLYLGQMASAAGLPMGARLSADASTLIAPAEAPAAAPAPAVADPERTEE